MSNKFKIALYWAFFNSVFKRSVKITFIHNEKVNRLKKAIKALNENLEKSQREMIHPAQMCLKMCHELKVKHNEDGRALIEYLQTPWAKLNLDTLARKIPY